MFQTQPCEDFPESAKWHDVVGMDVMMEDRIAYSPHVVVFLEKRVVLHSSLLELHIDATAIYRNHLLDSAKYYR